MNSTALVEGRGEGFPRRFGRYVLFDKIGEGGMANIYLGTTRTDLGGERLAVVKEILPMLASSSEFCRLLIDEAKLSAVLSHKNIVQVLDLGREQDKLYIAMEYVEGLDLRELLRLCSRKKIPLPVDFSLLVVVETLRALDYAHRKRDEDGRQLHIVHRDVSPSNVLLSVEGEIKLCDFGIARATGNSDLLPEEAVQGKAGYMSPEAARGDSVDQRSDIFSTGVVLYELLSGQRLYRSGPNRPSILEQARVGDIPRLPPRGYADEARLAGIVHRAVAQNPAERYDSAATMLADLERYVTDNRLVASPLRFGDFLMQHFGTEMIAHRRERERASKLLSGAPVAPASPRSAPDPSAASAASRPSPAPASGKKPSDGSFPSQAPSPQPGRVSATPARVSSVPPTRVSSVPPSNSLPSAAAVPAQVQSRRPLASGVTASSVLIALLAAAAGGLLAFFVLR